MRDRRRLPWRAPPLRRWPEREEPMAEMNIVEKVIALEGVDLLSGLQRDQLARIASLSTEVRHAPGQGVLDPVRAWDARVVVPDGAVPVARPGVEVDTARQT